MLHIVVKFQFNDACFQRGSINANFGIQWIAGISLDDFDYADDLALFWMTVKFLSISWNLLQNINFSFYIAAWNEVTVQRWESCLSIRPSVKCVDCDSTEERSVHIFIPYERSFSLVFWEEWLVGATPSTWNFGSTGPRWSKIADFEPIFACRARAITHSEKSTIDTNGKSTTCSPMSLIWSTYVACMLKMQNGQFPYKIALRLKKVCYKVCLCENCLRRSCKAFIGLTIHAKTIGGGRSLKRKFSFK